MIVGLTILLACPSWPGRKEPKSATSHALFKSRKRENLSGSSEEEMGEGVEVETVEEFPYSVYWRRLDRPNWTILWLGLGTESTGRWGREKGRGG